MTEGERNAEIVRRAYEAFNTADMETLTETFDESGGHWRDLQGHLEARAPKR